MKIKTIDHHYDEPYKEFDKRVNDLIKDKQVIDIKVNETISADCNYYSHTLTILYK